MERVEWVGATDPVVGKVLEGVGTWFKEVTDYARTKGKHKEFNIQTTTPSLGVVLHENSSGYAVGIAVISCKGR